MPYLTSFANPCVQTATVLGTVATLAHPVTAGNGVLVSLGWEGTTTPISVTDGLGTTYTQVGVTVTNASNIAVFAGTLGSSASSLAVTASYPGGAGYTRTIATEVNGYTGVDVYATATGNGGVPSASITPTASGEYLWATIGGFQSAGVFTATTPWGRAAFINGSDCSAVVTGQLSTGANTVNITQASNNYWVIIAVAIHAVAPANITIQTDAELGGTANLLGVVSGNGVMVSLGWEGSATPVSVTDSLGTTYTQVGSTLNNGTLMAVFAGLLSSSGTLTATAHFPGGASFTRIAACEIAGYTGVDTNATATGNGGTPSVSLTPGAVGEYLFAAVAGFRNAGVFSPVFPWQQVGFINGGDCLAIETGSLSTGANTVSVYQASNDYWTLMAVAITATGVSGGGPAPPLAATTQATIEVLGGPADGKVAVTQATIEVLGGPVDGQAYATQAVIEVLIRIRATAYVDGAVATNIGSYVY